MSADIARLLDEMQARCDAATDGPWFVHEIGNSSDQEPTSIVVHEGRFDWTDLMSEDSESAVAWMPRWERQEWTDAQFIASARTDLPRLIAAVRAVLDVHYPEPYAQGPDYCACEHVYPCPTITALTTALKETDHA